MLHELASLIGALASTLPGPTAPAPGSGPCRFTGQHPQHHFVEVVMSFLLLLPLPGPGQNPSRVQLRCGFVLHHCRMELLQATWFLVQELDLQVFWEEMGGVR